MEDILNALDMIVTYRGHVNRFFSASSMVDGSMADKTMIAEILTVMAVLMVGAVVQWIGFDQTAPFFRDFDWQTKHEWINRITASIATTLLVAFATIEGHTSHWGMVTGFAYFVHDTIHALLYETDITMFGHHIVSIIIGCLTKTVMSPAQVETVVSALAVLESTSPAVNLSWLLKRAGYDDQPWFKYVAGLVGAFFGIMRVVVFPWLMATKMDGVLQILFAPLVVLNVYWFWKIIHLVKKTLTKED